MVAGVHRATEEAAEYVEAAIIEATAVIQQCGRGAPRGTIQEHAIRVRSACMLVAMKLKEARR
jgi:hypothetical protein